MKKLSPLVNLSVLSLLSAPAMSAELDISIQNLTQGMYFTPIAAVAHIPSASLFEVGAAASPELQMMAEGGSLVALPLSLAPFPPTYWLIQRVAC